MQLPPNLQVRRQPPLHKPTLPGGPPLDKTAEKWHLKAEKYETIQIRSGCAFAPVPVRRQSRDGRVFPAKLLLPLNRRAPTRETPNKEQQVTGGLYSTWRGFLQVSS